MSPRSRNESALEGFVVVFRELPLSASLIAAPVLFVLLVWLVPLLEGMAQASNHVDPTGALVLAVVRSLSPLMGWILSVAVLLAGAMGAAERWLDRRKFGRANPQAPRVRETPACPVCGGRMALRESRRGKTAGEKFWGCGDFPRCRGTRPI